MGNKLNRQKVINQSKASVHSKSLSRQKSLVRSRSKQVNKISQRDLFTSPYSQSVRESVTFPSKCEAPSFNLSIPSTLKSTPSLKLRWSAMMNLVQEHQKFTHENLTANTLKLASTAMYVLTKNIRLIVDDYQAGIISLPEQVTERFKATIDVKNNAYTSQMQLVLNPLSRKILVHIIAMIYFHDLIITDFRNERSDLALNFLQQVAVSHALKGVQPMDFRLMDWFFINYLIKNEAVNEECLDCFKTYLTIVSNHLAHFFEEQSIRGQILKDITNDEPLEYKNDRFNKYRENYRIMKKWNEHISEYKNHQEFVENLLNATRQDAEKSKQASIDTITLKERDCIMKHCVRKRRRDSESTGDMADGSKSPTTRSFVE